MLASTDTETQELADLASAWRAAGSPRIAARITDAVRGWNPVEAMRIRWFLQGLVEEAEHLPAPLPHAVRDRAAALRSTLLWLRGVR